MGAARMRAVATGVVACLGIAGTAGSTAHAADSPEAAQLRTAVEDVAGATAVRFGAKDEQGFGLDGLDVVQAQGRTIGVSHTLSGDRFVVRVSTSTDLMRWTPHATLDADASQASILALPDGSFVVAYEKASWLQVLPRQALPPEQALLQGLVDRINLRFRRYATLAKLLAGRHDLELTAPLTRSRHAEGTPDLELRSWDRVLGVLGSDVGVSLHRYVDLTGDGFPDVDRQASGVMRGFHLWRTQDEPALDAQLAATHTPAAVGNFGDRDAVRIGGRRLVVHEVQGQRNRFGTWRLALRDPGAGTLVPLAPRTPGGSTAIANPSVVRVVSPAGRPATFVSAYVMSEGAAPGEAGEMLLYREDR